MNENGEFHAWPSLRWQGSGWWFTIASAAAAAITFIWPSLITQPSVVRITWTVVSIALAPLILLISTYVIRLLNTALKRMIVYPELFRTLQTDRTELFETKEMVRILVQERQDAQRFELGRVFRYGDSVFISLSLSSHALQVGDRVAVIDDHDGVVFGFFEVSEVRTDGYRARNIGAVNAVWAGFLHQFNQPETPAPPGTIALLVASSRKEL
jgi:hypothetical protein